MDMGTRRVCMKRQDIIVIVAEFGMGQPANGSQHLVRVSAFGHREDQRHRRDRWPRPPFERIAPFGRTLGDVVLARSEEHTSELQSLMRISYAVFCLKKKKT